MGFLTQSQKAGLLLKPRLSTPPTPPPKDLESAVVKPCFGMHTHAHNFGPGIEEIRPSDLGLGSYSGPFFLTFLPAVGCRDVLAFPGCQAHCSGVSRVRAKTLLLEAGSQGWLKETRSTQALADVTVIMARVL